MAMRQTHQSGRRTRVVRLVKVFITAAACAATLITAQALGADDPYPQPALSRAVSQTYTTLAARVAPEPDTAVCAAEPETAARHPRTQERR